MSEAHAYADALVQTIEEVTAGQWEGEQDEDALAKWFADVLELKAVLNKTVHGTDMVRADALVTFGGPNAWVRSTCEDFVDVVVKWGSDEARESVRAPALSYQLWEYCKMLQERQGDMW